MKKAIKDLLESPKTSQEIIDEEFIDDLESETEKKRKGRGTRSQSRYIGMNPKTHTAFFKTKDPKGSGTEHEQHIRFPEFTEIGRLQKNITTKEKVELAIKAGNVKVYCFCEDFIYRGYQYMADIGDYGTRQEPRFPDRNNPDLEGSLCKHLNSVAKDIDLFTDQMAEDFDNAKDNNYRVVKRN